MSKPPFLHLHLHLFLVPMLSLMLVLWSEGGKELVAIVAHMKDKRAVHINVHGL